MSEAHAVGLLERFEELRRMDDLIESSRLWMELQTLECLWKWTDAALNEAHARRDRERRAKRDAKRRGADTAGTG